MERQLVILNPRAGRMQAGRRLGELLPLLESLCGPPIAGDGSGKTSRSRELTLE